MKYVPCNSNHLRPKYRILWDGNAYCELCINEASAIAHDFRTAAGQFFYAAIAGACSASYCSGVL